MPEDGQIGKDPHLGLRFWVQIQGVEVAGFSECTGLTIETEVYEYREGGNNTYTHKLPVGTKYGNVTLKRGVDPGQDLFRWYVKSVDGLPEGRGLVSIMVYGQSGNEPVKQWDLIDAYPVKWVGPDLRTEAGATLIETLEFAHHGLNVTSGGK
jgi:phage tail-like protein